MRIWGFTYDPVSKNCKEFDTGGCSMTANGFIKKEDCEEKCSKYTFNLLSKNEVTNV